MKTSLKILLAAGLLCGAGMAASVPAAAQPSSFSFRVGDIGFAYQDGYYDRSHRWHAWRNAREHRWYRANYRSQYRGYTRDRDRDQYRGYNRDNDRDGVPNRYDRDRDNDGVPNYRDDRPNNPYRR